MTKFKFKMNPDAPLMRDAIHIHLDIETLATTTNAVVTEIGAAVCRYTEGMNSNITRYQYDLEWVSQTETREMSLETLQWHMEKGTAPRLIDPGIIRVNPNAAINELHALFNDCNSRVEDVFVWCKSKEFDLTILKSLFDEYGREWLPFDFRQAMELRTLEQLARMIGVPGKIGDATHKASSDAFNQAYYMRHVFDKMYEAYDHGN